MNIYSSLKVLVISLIICCLAGCAATGLSSKKALSKIEYGMTQKEVKSIMHGGPDFRRFEQGREQWEYLRTIVGSGEQLIIIDFENGKVVHMSTMPAPIRLPLPRL